jgi:hypothetical protein
LAIADIFSCERVGVFIERQCCAICCANLSRNC